MTSTPGWNPHQPPGRDPLLPFGAPPPPRANQPPPVDASPYTPRTNPTLIWAFVAAVVIIAGVVFVPTIVPQPAPSSSPSPGSQSPTPGPLPTIPEGVNGIPWESGDAMGTWQIDKSRFDGDGLVVTMTLRVDKGSLSYDWFAFDNAARDVYDPEYPGPDSLRPSTLNAGESATGTVRFGIKSGPATIILSTLAGRQITALLVRA